MYLVNKEILNDFIVFLFEKATLGVSAIEIDKIVGGIPTSTGFLGMGKKIAPAEFMLMDNSKLKEKISLIVKILLENLGYTVTENLLQDIYTRLEKKYSPVSVSEAVMPLIPENFLAKYRLKFLSKEELEKRDLELIKANEELLVLDKRKSEFLSIVAHQMRTPLSGIKWALDMILSGEVGTISDEQRKILIKTYDGNERMIDLIESMLHADRIEGGRYELHRSNVQIIDIISSVVDELSLNAQKKGVNVLVNIDKSKGEIPKLNVDPEKIRYVFQNLFENAVRYSNPGGKIILNLSVEKDSILCSIKDEGIGIPKDQQDQIFSRFFRAHNALKSDPNGNGLGLFIVKNIIEMHGGNIWFESKENEGTTFYFSIKL